MPSLGDGGGGWWVDGRFRYSGQENVNRPSESVNVGDDDIHMLPRQGVIAGKVGCRPRDREEIREFEIARFGQRPIPVVMIAEWA